MITEPIARGPVRALVGIATYRRPSGLEALLRSLAAQVFGSRYTVDVLVVDNDPEGSARAFVVEFARISTIPVYYRHEPVPGISAARNVALRFAADYKYLLFIDDDETADPEWVQTLIDGAIATESHIVHGGVEYDFPAGTPEWIRAGGFFVNIDRPAGASLPYAATNNLLFDVPRIASLGDFRFDLPLGLTGGSDVAITSQMVAAGGRISWWPNALVFESVPPERANARWVRRRARRTGESGANVRILNSRSRLALMARLSLASEAAMRVVAGALYAALGRLLGRPEIYGTGLRNVMRGLGIFKRSVGLRTTEYAR